MEWDDVRYFLVLARTGSLSAASRVLGVTHVTVARRIARLEQVRGVRLFHRRQRGYQLTAAGERLLAVGESVEKSCQYFERQMLGLSDIPQGVLTVSIPESTLVNLAKPLSAFMRAYPGIDLNVVATSERLNLESLQADLLIRVTNEPPEMLVGRRLGEIQFFAYGTRAYVEELGGDIKAAHWIVWEAEPGSEDDVYYPHVNAKEARITVRTNSNSQLLAMVREGGLIGLLASSVARLYPELARIGKEPLTTLGLWMLTHRDLRHAARVRCFMDFMSEYNRSGLRA